MLWFKLICKISVKHLNYTMERIMADPIPLKQFKNLTKMSNRQIGEICAVVNDDGVSVPWSVTAIQKMVTDKKRNIFVRNNEIFEVEVLDSFETLIDSADINRPHDHQVTIIKRIKPKGRTSE